jgi:hypothetical protein
MLLVVECGTLIIHSTACTRQQALCVSLTLKFAKVFNHFFTFSFIPVTFTSIRLPVLSPLNFTPSFFVQRTENPQSPNSKPRPSQPRKAARTNEISNRSIPINQSSIHRNRGIVLILLVVAGLRNDRRFYENSPRHDRTSQNHRLDTTILPCSKIISQQHTHRQSVNLRKRLTPGLNRTFLPLPSSSLPCSQHYCNKVYRVVLWL